MFTNTQGKFEYFISFQGLLRKMFHSLPKSKLYLFLFLIFLFYYSLRKENHGRHSWHYQYSCTQKLTTQLPLSTKIQIIMVSFFLKTVGKCFFFVHFLFILGITILWGSALCSRYDARLECWVQASVPHHTFYLRVQLPGGRPSSHFICTSYKQCTCDNTSPTPQSKQVESCYPQ